MKLCFAPNLGDPCQGVTTPELSPANLRMARPELIQWKSGEFTIEGLLYLPPAASGAKVPLIVDVHGGPMGAFVNRNDRLADFLVGQGWALLRPNPRGSSNYGLKFATANKNDLGGGDYRDIMAGVDAALAKYPLDANRMALIGYSYGGEMAAFVEGKTDRFKAIVSGAPVIDQFSEYGTESGSLEDEWYYGKPWEHMEDAWRQSPLSGAAHAKTPFMLLQGEKRHLGPTGTVPGDVSRVAQGGSARRTGDLSPRGPRPAVDRHVRLSIAGALARLRRTAADCGVHPKGVRFRSQQQTLNRLKSDFALYW
jgi:pimeloyl-ACP methyl ester carboxylesterase